MFSKDATKTSFTKIPSLLVPLVFRSPKCVTNVLSKNGMFVPKQMQQHSFGGGGESKNGKNVLRWTMRNSSAVGRYSHVPKR